MHEGCNGSFIDGAQIAEKLKIMGFESMQLPKVFEIKCGHCGDLFQMKTMISHCSCGMVYAVTPCHAHMSENIKPAGLNYE